MKSGLKRVIDVFEGWALALAVRLGWLRLAPVSTSAARKAAGKAHDSRRRPGRRRG